MEQDVTDTGTRLLQHLAVALRPWAPRRSPPPRPSRSGPTRKATAESTVLGMKRKKHGREYSGIEDIKWAGWNMRRTSYLSLGVQTILFATP